MEKKYKSKRFVDRLRWVVVDDDGKVINNNPSEDELKGLEKESRKSKDCYTKEKLINELRRYEKEYGRSPIVEDFTNNHEYPGFTTYYRYFGSWSNALQEAGYKNGNNKPRLKYKAGDVCYICTEEKRVTDKSLLRPGNACTEKDKNGKETGNVICWSHWSRYYERYDPDSRNSIIKELRDRRTGNLADPRHIFADNCQELTCIWRGVEDLNKTHDNYKWPIDHSRDSEFGIIDSMGRLYSPTYRQWSFGRLDRYCNKGIDHIICYCISEDGKTIERIYIFPKEEFENRTGIGIYKYDLKGIPFEYGWYEKCRVTNEEVIRKVNKIWDEILIEKEKKEDKRTI